MGGQKEDFMKRQLILAALSGAALTLGAVETAPVFTDDMVLQRDAPIRVWGTGKSGEKVEVTFGDLTFPLNWSDLIDKLAKLIDMQNSTLNRYENGLRVPSIAQAIKIADYFGLNIEMMLIMGLAAKEGDDIGAMYDKIQQDFEMMRQLMTITPKKG